MAVKCAVCSKEISSEEVEHSYKGIIMHFTCLPEFQKTPEKYGGKARKYLTSSELLELEQSDEGKLKKRAELKEKSKGMVLTDIDLPFGRVFWVTVQFFVAGLVLAIPLWIILMVILNSPLIRG